jgi:hypothetical protein
MSWKFLHLKIVSKRFRFENKSSQRIEEQQTERMLLDFYAKMKQEKKKSMVCSRQKLSEFMTSRRCSNKAERFLLVFIEDAKDSERLIAPGSADPITYIRLRDSKHASRDTRRCETRHSWGFDS